jgi:hypothetical protein
MRLSEVLFWIVWIIMMSFLIITFSSYSIFNFVLFIILFVLTGIAMYSQVLNAKRFYRLKIMIKNIDFKPLEEEVIKIENKQKESSLKLLRLERSLDDFENYKIEQEEKYRDVVRKVLEVDNDFNRKYKLLGESIIKLNKDIKK